MQICYITIKLKNKLRSWNGRICRHNKVTTKILLRLNHRMSNYKIINNYKINNQILKMRKQINIKKVANIKK